MVSKLPKRITADQRAIANFLHGLSEAKYKLHEKTQSGYITLDRQTGTSTNNKNAVSVFRNSVLFMASNPSEVVQQANQLKLPGHLDGKRVMFKNIKLSSFEANSAFFRDLLMDAEREAMFKQARKSL